MIIDIHQHVFWHGRDVHGLIEDMDENGIDKACVLNWDIAPDEDVSRYHKILNPAHVRDDGTFPGVPLSDCIKAKELYPERFILGYAPHTSRDNAPDLFEAAYRIHGVRVCGELKARMLYDDPRCLNLFRKAGELGCPVVVHIDVPYRRNEIGELRYQRDWYGGTVDNLERAVKECPDTIFLGHAPGFWREMSGDAADDPAEYPDGPVTEGGKLWRLFEEFPNLYGDLSADSALISLSRDNDNAIKFLTTFADKLCFARDYFGSKWQDYLNSLNLPKDVMDKIYYKNAEKLINDE